MSGPDAGQVPLWAKALYSLMAGAVALVYAVKYKPGNFLWFSDIALIGCVPAMWLENALLASTLAVAVLLPELAWNADFFCRLLFGWRPLGLSDYMFESHRPLYLRCLSLFHVALPIVLVWLVYRLGYDRRAWVVQTGVAWVVLPLTYLLTDPHDNINWVFGPGSRPQRRVPPLLYLVLLMCFFPAIVYLPTHWVLSKIFVRRAS